LNKKIVDKLEDNKYNNRFSQQKGKVRDVAQLDVDVSKKQVFNDDFAGDWNNK